MSRILRYDYQALISGPGQRELLAGVVVVTSTSIPISVSYSAYVSNPQSLYSSLVYSIESSVSTGAFTNMLQSSGTPLLKFAQCNSVTVTPLIINTPSKATANPSSGNSSRLLYLIILIAVIPLAACFYCIHQRFYKVTSGTLDCVSIVHVGML